MLGDLPARSRVKNKFNSSDALSANFMCTLLCRYLLILLNAKLNAGYVDLTHISHINPAGVP